MAEAVNSRHFLRLFRRRGGKVALSAFAAAVLFAVVDAVVGDTVKQASDSLIGSFRSSEFVVGFSQPLQTKPTVTVQPLVKDETVTISEVTLRRLKAVGKDHHYWVELEVQDGADVRRLIDKISFSDDDRAAFLETDPVKWQVVHIDRPKGPR